MKKIEKTWLWLAAAVSFLVGMALLMNDNSGAGLFLIILGIVNLGASTRAGQGLDASNGGLVGWGLIGLTLLIVLLAVIVGAVLLLS